MNRYQREVEQACMARSRASNQLEHSKDTLQQEAHTFFSCKRGLTASFVAGVATALLFRPGKKHPSAAAAIVTPALLKGIGVVAKLTPTLIKLQQARKQPVKATDRADPVDRPTA